MGYICMAVFGSLSATCLLVLLGGEDVHQPMKIAATYLAGGLSGMALAIASYTMTRNL